MQTNMRACAVTQGGRTVLVTVDTRTGQTENIDYGLRRKHAESVARCTNLSAGGGIRSFSEEKQQ